MSIDNLDEKISFITSDEAGKFLAWLSENDFCGKINASACGTISIRGIIQHIEWFYDLLDRIVSAELLIALSVDWNRWQDLKPFAWEYLTDRTWLAAKEEELT